jgi:hypothetical protein
VIVPVMVIVIVAEPVIVAVHVNGNAPVGVIVGGLGRRGLHHRASCDGVVPGLVGLARAARAFRDVLRSELG